MKTRTLCIAVSAALWMGTAALPSSAADTMEHAKNVTENAVDSTIDKLPPKRAMTRAEYSAQKESIEANYKTAHASCGSLTGNSKAVCRVEARSDEKMKFADLEARYKATPGADIDARVEKAKAQYEVAEQKCEGQAGVEKTACKASAKADKDRAISDAKAAKTASAN